MRLWHKDLIPYLDRERLVAQWRELSAIAGNIQLKGTPNHILVNKVMNYPFDHFISYAMDVRDEMTRRGYKTMEKVWDKIVAVNDKDYWSRLSPKNQFPNWHTTRYLTQCLMNLEEKYDCGNIDEKVWHKIEEEFDDYL